MSPNLTESIISVVKPAGLAAVFLAISVLGCGGGDGQQRVVVSGTVSYAGQTLEQGVIRFIPQAGMETAVCGAPIIAGEYTIDAKGGVPVGSYKVEIRQAAALDKEAAQIDEDDDSPRVLVNQSELPAKYNIHSQLEIVIAPDSEKIIKDFHLTR